MIQKTNYFLPIWLQILMSAVSSACFLILFRGTWSDMPAAFLAGGAGYLRLLAIQHLTKVKFFSEFFASFVVALVAFLLSHLGYGNELDKIIISGVMPLVPGILITNAVRGSDGRPFDGWNCERDRSVFNGFCHRFGRCGGCGISLRSNGLWNI